MTVKELKEKLNGFQDDLPVILEYGELDFTYLVSDVSVVDNPYPTLTENNVSSYKEYPCAVRIEDVCWDET